MVFVELPENPPYLLPVFGCCQEVGDESDKDSLEMSEMSELKEGLTRPNFDLLWCGGLFDKFKQALFLLKQLVGSGSKLWVFLQAALYESYD